jgi:hypothetical protein
VIILSFKENWSLWLMKGKALFFCLFGFDHQTSVQLTKVFLPKALIAKNEPVSPAAKFRIMTTLRPSGEKPNSFSVS